MEKCIQTRTLRSAIPAALLLFLPLLVQAQVTCTASVPAQPVLRQEGIAEPAADILIACQGTQAGLQSIALSASAPITSRPLVSYAWAFDSVPTEAALLINDSTASPIQGFLENGSLVFDGFPLPTAGTFTLRITNLRIDANATSPGATITGKLASTFSISNGAALPLGTVATSLNVTLSSAPNYSGCAASSNPVQILTISELIGTAFKPAASSAANNTPGGWYQSGFNSESQTIFPIPATWNCTLC